MNQPIGKNESYQPWWVPNEPVKSNRPVFFSPHGFFNPKPVDAIVTYPDKQMALVRVDDRWYEA